MHNWKSVFFWCVLVLSVAGLISLMTVKGCEYNTHKRTVRHESYRQCVQKAKDVRECRDILLGKRSCN